MPLLDERWSCTSTHPCAPHTTSHGTKPQLTVGSSHPRRTPHADPIDHTRRCIRLRVSPHHRRGPPLPRCTTSPLNDRSHLDAPQSRTARVCSASPPTQRSLCVRSSYVAAEGGRAVKSPRGCVRAVLPFEQRTACVGAGHAHAAHGQHSQYHDVFIKLYQPRSLVMQPFFLCVL